jgi:O-acetylserine/cysteine efflux transporter
MSRRDISAALLCVVLWGVNFVLIDEGLRTFPPILFVALRFTLTALPAIFFVPKPQVGWRAVLAVGVLIGVLQFGCLFVAMHRGLPAGLASIVLQSQAVFTILFAVPIIRERPSRSRVAALVVAVAGMVLIAFGRGAAVPMDALLLGLAAGAAWGAGNVVTRASRPPHPFSLLIYSAAAASIPLTVLSLAIEGWATDLTTLKSMTWSAFLSLCYVVIASTLVGFGLWYRLLSRNESSLVAPFTLLVPVIGIAAAWASFDERPGLIEVLGCLIVLGALARLIRSAERPRRWALTRRAATLVAPSPESPAASQSTMTGI